MNNQIILKLKSKIEDISSYNSVDAETQRNAVKEELQFYILNFIYHHPEYSNWTMYGGSALRICHGLNRMSVDLDFETNDSCSENFLDTLKSEIQSHFLNTYNVDADFLNIKIAGSRGLRLNFNIGDQLGIAHPSRLIHVKLDLNCFTAPKTAVERIPINRDQLSFVIKTYTMSVLMASKIAAIFLRGTRGVGADIYQEKGRDIYDLLWYMDKQIIPDLDYLIAKNVDVSDLQNLFNKLTIKMNGVDNTNLENDLKPLFFEHSFIVNWLKSWRENYVRLLRNYPIYTVTNLHEIVVRQDFHTDNFSFIYYYETEGKKIVRIIYTLSNYWIIFSEGNLSIHVNGDVKRLIRFSANRASSKAIPEEKLKQYATLFYKKTEEYLKKTHREILTEVITTKIIRMTADNLNQKEHIVLDRSALTACDLDDLLQ